MTAVSGPVAAPPPRILIQTFWVLHRAMYRVSSGRFGLSRPEAGARFGMMRLSTIGRRSGQRRMTMIGYYQDGANLVTLAMNGWADAEPAWWLNLQAAPDTTVDLPDGSRPVRARAATGAERDRLWARFRDFPGWGDDIDALAARRSIETAVVVFEPGLQAPPAGSSSGRGGGSVSAVQAPSVAAPRRRLSRRHLWLIPGLAVGVYASTWPVSMISDCCCSWSSGSFRT